VSQIVNLRTVKFSNNLPTASRRHCRLPTCATNKLRAKAKPDEAPGLIG